MKFLIAICLAMSASKKTNGAQQLQVGTLAVQVDGGDNKKISEKMRNLNSLTEPKKRESLIVSKKVDTSALE